MTISLYYPQSTAVLMGLSTDTKPTNVAPGTKFVQTDNSDVFIFLNTGSWTQIGTLTPSASVALGAQI